MALKLIKIGSWALVALIVCFTLSPIGLRPNVGGASLERFSALALVGLMFGLSYPKRFWTVLIAVCLGTFLLEALQYLTPDRHGRLSDALVKMSGGALGAGLSWLAIRVYGVVSQPRLAGAAKASARSK